MTDEGKARLKATALIIGITVVFTGLGFLFAWLVN